MRIFTLVVAGLTLSACGGSSGDPDTDNTDTSDTDAVGDDDDDDDDTTTIETTAHLSGVITDEAGSPVDGANIRFCRGAQCRYFTTESDGVYFFADTAVAPQSFEVVPPPTSGLTTAFAPLNFASNEQRVVDVSVPAEGTSVTLPAAMTELDFGDLHITMGADDLEAPLFVDEATEASVTRVPMEDWLPVDDLTGTVVAMWYLMPFDHHSNAGMDLRMDLGSLGLSGDTYRVYLGSYEESAWKDLGTVTDGGGGLYEGVSLPLISTVIVVEE